MQHRQIFAADFRTLCGLFALIILCSTFTVTFAAESEEFEARFRKFSNELRCPTCQGLSVKDSEIPIHKDYVRLIHAAGEWRLHPLDESSTEVTYTWNGELLGDFPDWALNRAWKTQGDEVLNWLKEAVQD